MDGGGKLARGLLLGEGETLPVGLFEDYLFMEDSLLKSGWLSLARAEGGLEKVAGDYMLTQIYGPDCLVSFLFWGTVA